MNCERYQERINEALASGDRVLNVEIAMHLKVCGACQEFYEKQRRLFAAMDAGVRAMMNEAVPASLLPVPGLRMEGISAAPVVWRPAWLIAAAAGVILAIAFGVMRRSPEQNPLRANPGSVSSSNSAAMVAVPNDPATIRRERKNQGVLRKTTLPAGEPPEQLAEVIVLSNEGEAFARFVAQLPKEKEATAGLTRPALEQENTPVEIALLQIQELKVEPLEPAEEK